MKMELPSLSYAPERMLTRYCNPRKRGPPSIEKPPVDGIFASRQDAAGFRAISVLSLARSASAGTGLGLDSAR